MKEQQKESRINRHDDRIISSIWSGIKNILNIRDGVKKKEVASDIVNNINFTRHNAWILVCAIILASIGLNTNNKAVIIGAMLVSPLMGPILGIGLTSATNDYPNLYKSLRNLGIAVLLSILTSTIYFLITPIKSAQSELLSRTEPTIFDVLIALAGGFAGIIAGLKKDKHSNVISGVSIATALMPPLCTAGYGLATSQYDFFTGAIYLFFINTVFISISTWIIVRLLDFDIIHALTPAKDKIWKYNILLLSIIVTVPSAWTAIKVVRKSLYQNKAENYIRSQFTFDQTKIISKEVRFSNDDSSRISLTLYGLPIPEESIQEKISQNRLSDFGIEGTKVDILQSKDHSDDLASAIDKRFEQKFNSEIKASIFEELITNKNELIDIKDAMIDSLVNVVRRHKNEQTEIAENQVTKEISALYDNIEQISFVEEKLIDVKDGSKSDLQPVTSALIKWKRRPRNAEKEKTKLANFLKVRLHKDSVRVHEFY